jgi:hypothetical protein
MSQAGIMAQVVKVPAYKCEALSSNPSVTNNNNNNSSSSNNNNNNNNNKSIQKKRKD